MPKVDRTALYRLYSAQDELLYVGISGRIDRRMDGHAISQPWWGDVARAEATWHDTREAADTAETAAILAEGPRYNIAKTGNTPRRAARKSQPPPASPDTSDIEFKPYEPPNPNPENDSAYIRAFGLGMVPSLATVPAYAQEVLRKWPAMEGATGAQHQETLSAQLRHQEILYNPRAEVRILLDEAALRLRVVPASVMKDQLERLLTLERLPTVELAVMPYSTRRRVMPRTGFTLYGGLMRVETYTHVLHIRNPQTLQRAHLEFEITWAYAEEGDEATAFIREVMESLE